MTIYQKENIIRTLETFTTNVDIAFEIGEADGTFAHDHALDEAWRIFDEDIESLDLSDEVVEVLNIVALGAVFRHLG